MAVMGDVGAVELEEGEEFGAEFVDFDGVEFEAVGGEVVEEGFGESGCHGHNILDRMHSHRLRCIACFLVEGFEVGD